LLLSRKRRIGDGQSAGTMWRRAGRRSTATEVAPLASAKLSGADCDTGISRSLKLRIDMMDLLTEAAAGWTGGCSWNGHGSGASTTPPDR
jgi:hypothetical protein